MGSLSRGSSLGLLDMPECKWLRDNGKCNFLKGEACTGKKCSFRQKENISMEKAYARLRSLDEETQRRIAQKYYNGSRPWTDADTRA
ncbi:hypothetical protein FACS1894191_0170 [Clostridia bacterium]|nr:hypothetical protein FACS1894191_0170 [Clostridia bacterium]